MTSTLPPLPGNEEQFDAWVDAALDVYDRRSGGNDWRRRAVGYSFAAAMTTREDHRRLYVWGPANEVGLIIKAARDRGVSANALLGHIMGRWLIETQGVAEEDLPWMTGCLRTK